MIKKLPLLLAVLFVTDHLTVKAAEVSGNMQATANLPHVESTDLKLVDDAFMYGYARNLFDETVDGRGFQTLGIQCVSNGKPDGIIGPGKKNYSVWTRDLYWGFLGWAQAGDDDALKTMKSSIQLLILAKNKNQAIGQSKGWPLNDERFYIPQAYTPGLAIAMNFFPWCSESQADFLLLARNYWKLSGDTKFIESIWPDICYVEKTIELMDTDGNSLPDDLWGSYDYQGVGRDTEEPLMSAKTAAAYRAVAELARQLNKPSYAGRLETLADNVQKQMDKPVELGGLWKNVNDHEGYFINMRFIKKGQARIDDRFIPYENLVPMFMGVTTPEQDGKILNYLDENFDKFYNLKYGPMFTVYVTKRNQDDQDCASSPWLGFLDVYLRIKKNHLTNCSEIYRLLIAHAYEVPAACFSEGAGIYGDLTGGSGRTWDNGSFFYTFISAIYGLEKSKDGIAISAPASLESAKITELNNMRWRKAVYNFKWKGSGAVIKSVEVNGKVASPMADGRFLLAENTGVYDVVITRQ